MKAINVSRVSTEEQKEAGNSLPAQIERIRKYCERKGFDVAKNIFSFDESAYMENRDDFDNKVITCNVPQGPSLQNTKVMTGGKLTTRC